jgi:hypothetical protein
MFEKKTRHLFWQNCTLVYSKIESFTRTELNRSLVGIYYDFKKQHGIWESFNNIFCSFVKIHVDLITLFYSLFYLNHELGIIQLTLTLKIISIYIFY